MKKLLTLTNIASAVTVLALTSACQTTATGPGAGSGKEPLLAQSGFKIITVTTPKQQQAVSGLAQGRCSAVKYNGKLYYVYPTAQKDRIYVGRQKQFNAYKQTLAAQQQQQTAAQPVFNIEEHAGPQTVEFQQFQGFGPMGVQSLGNW